MGDENCVPGRRRRPREKPLSLAFGKIRFVGDENAGIRIKGEEFPRRLGEAMAGNHNHRFGDQPQAALFHDGRSHCHRLARADSVRKIGRACGDDTPDAAFLVGIEREGAGRPGQVQMVAVEGARRDIVEAVVVDPCETVGAVGVRPDPGLERRLNLLQLLPRRFGVDDVEHAPLARLVLDRVEDLRDPAVERVSEQFAGMATICAPFRGARRRPAELPRLHGPRREFRHVEDTDFGVHGLAHEGDDVGRRYPGAAEPSGDVGRAKICGLHGGERPDVALEGGIERRPRLGRIQLLAHGTGEIGVRHLPRAVRRILKDDVAKLGDDGGGVLMHEFGDLIEIDAAALVQDDGERVGGRGDHRRGGWGDDPLGKDRPRPRGVGVEIVVFDRGDEPAIGIVEERLKVRPPVAFPDLAGCLVFDHGNRGVIDRTELAHEARPRDAQAHLGLLPRSVLCLAGEHLAHGVADRD